MSPHRLLLSFLVCLAAVGDTTLPAIAVATLPEVQTVHLPDSVVGGVPHVAASLRLDLSAPNQPAFYLFTGHPAIRPWTSSRRHT